MKKIIFNRVSAILLALAMLLSVFGGALGVSADSADTSAVSNDWQLMAEDSGLKLFLNRKTTNFYVEDAASGKRTYAFPENVQDDKIAVPLQQIEMQATLVFTLWDPVKKSESRKNSRAASVNGGNFKIREQENGFFVDYNLKTSGVEATLSVVLKDGKLECTIPAGSVKENDPEKARILRIAVLPFMISGLSGTDGQIILPDGCGEILDFSPLRAAAAVYQKPIYGRNLSMNLSIEEKTGYDIKTPYLALISGDTGVLSIPTAGAAVGYVNANPAGKQSSFANAYYSFQYRASDVAIIGDRASKTAQSTVVIDENAYDKDITVSYQFIFENADIYSLAKLYGQYLAPASKASVKADETAVFDIYGFVNEKKSFFGFPYTAQSVLSSGKDIIKLANDDAFDNIAINLKNITSDHQKSRLNTTLKPLSKVLSAGELKKLTSGDASIYVNANPLTFKKNSLNANNFWGASKTLYGAPINLYTFKESTHLVDKNISKSYLLTYGKIAKTTDKLISSAKKLSLDGISSEQLAAISYHDYDKNGTLEDTRKAQEAACAKAAGSTALMLTNPADYAIKYCSMLLDIPTSSSNNDLCAGSYPFIQMALGDSIPYTVESVNLNRSPETALLQAMATGSLLHFSFALTDSEPIIGTELNFLYSANYASYKEQAERQYASWCELRDKTDGSAITKYSETDGVITTVFANGTVFTANISDKTYSISN